MKKGFYVVAALLLAGFVSCKEENVDLSVCTGVSFEESKIIIEEGSEADVNVVLEPEGTDGFNNVNYRIINEKIAQIVFSDGMSCRVSSKKSGATILVAECGEQEAKAIISVKSKETVSEEESARKAESKDSFYYIYTITYRFEEGYASTCFVKEDGDDFDVVNGQLVIVRDNGMRFSVSMDDLYDFSIEKRQ